MWRTTARVGLALAIGFVLYRVALVAVPIGNEVGASPTLNCPEGNVPRAVFDGLTGLPGGVVVSCANRAGQYAVQWGPIEAASLGGHWGRAALVGLAGAAVALVALWSVGRRRPGAVERPSELLPSA